MREGERRRGEREGEEKGKEPRLTQLPAGNVSILNIPPIITDSAPRVIDEDFNTAIVECSMSGVGVSSAIRESYGTIDKLVIHWGGREGGRERKQREGEKERGRERERKRERDREGKREKERGWERGADMKEV